MPFIFCNLQSAICAPAPKISTSVFFGSLTANPFALSRSILLLHDALARGTFGPARINRLRRCRSHEHRHRLRVHVRQHAPGHIPRSMSSPEPVTGGASEVRSRSVSEPEEHHDQALNRDELGAGESPDPSRHVRSSHRRELVDHEIAVRVQTVEAVRSKRHPQEWCRQLRGGEWTDRDRVGGTKPIILKYQGGPWLGCVDPAGHSPQFSANHLSQSVDTASMKSWSSDGRFATSADCRSASAANSGDRTSGTHTCTRRNPCSRIRCR